MRTIRVTGKAILEVKPNQTQIILQMKGIEKEYIDVIKHTANDLDLVKKSLKKCGIDSDKISTKYLDIYEKTEYRKDDNGYAREYHIGFSYSHALSVIIGIDNKLLGKILYEASKLENTPSISIEYKVENPEKYKSELIDLAVKDAKRKAEVMAKASEVNLGKIMNISYSYSKIILHSNNYDLSVPKLLNCENSIDIDINPEKINVTDSISVVWEIE